MKFRIELEYGNETFIIQRFQHLYFINDYNVKAINKFIFLIKI